MQQLLPTSKINTRIQARVSRSGKAEGWIAASAHFFPSACKKTKTNQKQNPIKPSTTYCLTSKLKVARSIDGRSCLESSIIIIEPLVLRENTRQTTGLVVNYTSETAATTQTCGSCTWGRTLCGPRRKMAKCEIKSLNTSMNATRCSVERPSPQTWSSYPTLVKQHLKKIQWHCSKINGLSFVCLCVLSVKMSCVNSERPDRYFISVPLL